MVDGKNDDRYNYPTTERGAVARNEILKMTTTKRDGPVKFQN